VIQRQQFEVVIQARIGTKPFARERIPPYRKDVMTTKSGKTVGGGDVTRKKKHQEKQKEGKKRAKSIGRVTLTQEAFWSVLAKD
jgi:GTP-binding protein LepA